MDIAKIINDEIAAAGGVLDGTLIKSTAGTRTPGSLTGGVNPTTVSHAFKGFIEKRTEVRKDGQLVAAGGEIVTVLGASLPSGVTPDTQDRVTIEGTTYDVAELLDRDPAAATYELLVQSS